MILVCYLSEHINFIPTGRISVKFSVKVDPIKVFRQNLSIKFDFCGNQIIMTVPEIETGGRARHVGNRYYDW